MELKKFHFIYKITNLVNGKIYVGHHSTNNINDGYLGSSHYLLSDIKKLGKENFKREILQFCKYEELSNLEKKFILELNSIKFGYNKHIKGTGQKLDYKHSEETKAKLNSKRRNISGENNPMYGKRGEQNPNFGKKLWEGKVHPMKGKKHSEETKLKQSESKKDKYNGENNPFYGKKHSEESINKMNESKRERFLEFGCPLKGVKKSDQAKINYSKNWNKRELLVCPKCGLSSRNKGNMNRYHFNNCKKT